MLEFDGISEFIFQTLSRTMYRKPGGSDSGEEETIFLTFFTKSFIYGDICFSSTIWGAISSPFLHLIYSTKNIMYVMCWLDRIK